MPPSLSLSFCVASTGGRLSGTEAEAEAKSEASERSTFRLFPSSLPRSLALLRPLRSPRYLSEQHKAFPTGTQCESKILVIMLYVKWFELG